MAQAERSFDVIVIGTGSMGAAACYYLAKQKHKVLGLEQFSISHEYGSHAGQSRIIRKAYFEDPGYVPLLNKSYENWKALEADTGTTLYHRTGLAYFGKEDNALMKGVRLSASLYNVGLEKMDAAAAVARFPSFNIPSDFEALYEPDAGFLPPEKCIRLYADQAIKHGATISTNEKVLDWKREGNGISVKTNIANYACKKLIITAGAWAAKMIPGLSSKIKITRQFLAWIKPGQKEEYMLDKFPCWMIADDGRAGAFYGFPVLPKSMFGEPEGLKLALHYPAEATDPDNVNRETKEEDMEPINYVLDKYFPGAFESVIASKICLYANTPDENFIIDLLPGYEENVAIACGFSGHGFKFASAVGEILCDLATKGNTTQPIGFLNAKRFDSVAD